MKGIRSRLLAYLESLRFPWLLLVTVGLFLVSIFVPDPFPFIDEILLGLVAVFVTQADLIEAYLFGGTVFLAAVYGIWRMEKVPLDQ